MATDAAESAPLLSADDRPTTADSLASTTSSTKHSKTLRRQHVVMVVAFIWSLVTCLCAGSISGYSLYGHLFQSRLNYTQLQVNTVSISSGIAMYATIPVFGFLCDRLGSRAMAGAAAVLFAFGYVLAALTYRGGATMPGELPSDERWPFWVMVVSFVAIGAATTAMYIAAVSNCAKNFGRGRFKGIALASPITCFGLSSMWLSQVASHVFYERLPDGRHGDVDVFRFFIFLAILLAVVGCLGVFALQVVNEEELIDDAVDELERSGLLEESEFFRGRPDYGAAADDDDADSHIRLTREEEERKKTWLLNEETRRFLKDPTMWLLTAGFFFTIGPGETFLNNVGTIIGTLQPPNVDNQGSTTPATHVSLVAIGSTAARLFSGTMTDLLAPPASTPRFGSVSNSVASLPPRRRFTVSRVVFLLAFALLMSLGELFLASGLVQNHGERFWVVSLLMGCGYGAVFSLTPIIVTVIWGVENFGTNWGIVAMAPAVSGTIWGFIYATVYESAASQSPYGDGPSADTRCYGKSCYQGTFWGITITTWIACGLWIWAWKGSGGWSRRGISV